MKNLALQRIKDIENYTPSLSGRAEYKGTLLDFNERTKPPSKKVRDALVQYAESGNARLYPQYEALQEKIAAYAGVATECVLLTNGSEQGIDVIFRTFTQMGEKAVIPSPSFGLFTQYAQNAGCTLVQPLYQGSDTAFPRDAVLRSIDEGAKFIIVCNPNSPTGTLVPLSDIENIVRAAETRDALVYVDEAYFEFSGLTAVSLIAKYPNVVITRTFSKAFGLAGLRVGYLLASPEHCTEMAKVRGPYPVNMAGVHAATAALEDTADMQKYVDEVMNTAKPFVEAFFRDNGIKTWPSCGNFILFWPKEFERVARTLSERGFAVRGQNRKGIEGAMRVSIGTMEEMKIFVQKYPL